MELWDVAGQQTQANLTAYARDFAERVLPNNSQNTLNLVIPDRPIDGIRSRVTQVTRRKVTARYRTWNGENYIGERPVAVNMTDVELPPFGQLLPLTEWERIKLYMAETGTEPLDRIAEQMYEDTEHNVAATLNRAEQARGQFLFTGKFTLNEHGLVGVEYDAEVPGTHIYTVGTWWSDPDAPVLTQESNAAKLIRDDASGASGKYLVGPQAAFDYLRANKEYKLSYYGYDAPGTARRNLTISEINQVRVDNGLPPLFPYDNRLEIDGIDTRVTPSNKVAYVSEAYGEFQWGITATGLDLVAGRNVDFKREDAPGLVATGWKKPNPTTGYSQLDATGMPVAGDPAGVVIMQVLPSV